MSKWQDEYDIEISHYDGKFYRFKIEVFHLVHEEITSFRTRYAVFGYIWAFYRCWVHHLDVRHKHG